MSYDDLHPIAFQSTPSAWRETLGMGGHCIHWTISIHSLRMEGDMADESGLKQATDFNPLPPHGGRPPVSGLYDAFYGISIHSLRMEGDPSTLIYTVLLSIFQSTPSAWRETQRLNDLRQCINYFNPLPPHGGRPTLDSFSNHLSEFQSTPSAWRETQMSTWKYSIWHFNPLPPHGGRPVSGITIDLRFTISIHSLRMEGDRQRKNNNYRCGHFNPLPPHGGRPRV